MLAEVDLDLACVIVYEASCKVDVPVAAAEIRKEAYVVLQCVRITVQLSLQDFERGFGICKGRMCILQILAAVELVCGSECAAFQLVVDVLHIHAAGKCQVDIYACTYELLGKQWNIETVAVESSQVTTLEKVCQFPGLGAEGRAVLYIGIIYAVYLACLLGDMTLGVDAHRQRLAVAVRLHAYQAYLDNAVVCNIDTRSLQVKEDYGLFEIQLHSRLTF